MDAGQLFTVRLVTASLASTGAAWSRRHISPRATGVAGLAKDLEATWEPVTDQPEVHPLGFGLAAKQLDAVFSTVASDVVNPEVLRCPQHAHT